MHTETIRNELVKNPPANAGGTGSILGLGRSHMPRGKEARLPQPPSSTHREPVLPNKRHRCSEKPPLTAREKPCAAAKTQHSQKYTSKRIFKN